MGEPRLDEARLALDWPDSLPPMFGWESAAAETWLLVAPAGDPRDPTLVKVVGRDDPRGEWARLSFNQHYVWRWVMP